MKFIEHGNNGKADFSEIAFTYFFLDLFRMHPNFFYLINTIKLCTETLHLYVLAFLCPLPVFKSLLPVC